MTSKTTERSHEDIDEKALTYAEIKALASGNPLIVEKTELDTDVSKLKLLKQSYLSEIYALEDAIVKYYPAEIKKCNELILAIQKDIETIKENIKIDNDEKFSGMTLNGKYYAKKEEAGKKILEICSNKENSELEEIGEYRGMKLFLEINTREFVLKIKNNSLYTVTLGTDVYGNITRIDNEISNMEKHLENAKIKLDNLEKQFETAKIDSKRTFDKEEELQKKMQRLSEVNKELEIKDNENEIVDDVEETKAEDINNKELVFCSKEDFR